MKEVMSIRLEDTKIQALELIHEATKIPVTELVRQGVDRVIETYSFYIPDAEFRRELGLVFSDSDVYLRRLAKND